MYEAEEYEQAAVLRDRIKVLEIITMLNKFR